MKAPDAEVFTISTKFAISSFNLFFKMYFLPHGPSGTFMMKKTRTPPAPPKAREIFTFYKIVCQFLMSSLKICCHTYSRKIRTAPQLLVKE